MDGYSGQLLLRRSSESVICNVAVITHLLLCWQIWHQAGDSLMELILSALVVLVRKDHPHLVFNVRQLQAAGLVKLLCHMYVVSAIALFYSQAYLHITCVLPCGLFLVFVFLLL